jgi:hypothetical protein
MADGATTQFPRWRVWNRVLQRTEEDVGTIWGALLVALAFGFVGAFWVQPRDAGWSARFFGAVGVAAIATAGAWFVLLAANLLLYRRRGDRDWQISWSVYSREPKPGISSKAHGVGLLRRLDRRARVADLGLVEALVRLPAGDFYPTPQRGMGAGPDAVSAYIPRIEVGTYEVR